VFSFKARPIYSSGKSDDNIEVGDWEGPRDRLDVLGTREMSSIVENITTIPQSPGRVLVTAPNELSQLLLTMQME
jgi:hypothetical protein